MAKTGEQIYEEFRTRMSQSAQKMKDGASNTDRSQSGNAIAAKQIMIDNLTKALADGKWEEGLRKAGDEKWLRNFLEKGVAKVVAGIDANKDDIIQKFEKVGRVGDKVRKAVSSMPKGTFQDSVNRAAESMKIQKEEWGKA